MQSIKKHIRNYTVGEEIFNGVSHGIGALFGIIGTTIIIFCAVLYSDVWGIVSASIYGGTIILLYTMSTLYHSLTNKTAKEFFQILDHSTIFLLIAGSYTPYTLVTLKNDNMGIVLFAVVWGCAVIGVILNAMSVSKYKKVSMILYIVSGWAAVFAIPPIFANLDKNGIILMILGGVFYTVGIIFYALKKVPYAHSIWHLFVLTGSVLHYFSILFYVIL